MEDKQAMLDAELRRIDMEIKETTLKRPTAAQVQAFWSEFVDLWPEMTDEEKREMIGLVVKRIEVKQKDRAYLELTSIQGNHGQKFVTSKKWERVAPLAQTMSVLQCTLRFGILLASGGEASAGSRPFDGRRGAFRHVWVFG